MMKPAPVSMLAIVGPTASGKSGLALKIARAVKGEIVAADSRTIYRGMDIGTAKPSPGERDAVKHHLLDVVDPNETFSAADFQEQANKAIYDIQNRNTLPVMVGGSGLYIDSVIFDYDFTHDKQTKRVPDAREGMPREALQQLSLTELQAMAKAENLPVPEQVWRNPRHLAGLIARAGEPARRKAEPDADVLMVGLSPPKESLHASIEQRIHEMFTNGLVQEVKQLSERYGWDAPGLNAIGYREFQAYFAGAATLEETREAILKNTKAYAKRQLTWFKRNKRIQWFESADRAYDFVVQALKIGEPKP